jgi:hypothetical protein
MVLRHVLIAGLIVSATASFADEPVIIELALKEHKFEPAEIKAPAGAPVTIKLKNYDASPEEFDSTALKVEKIVTPNGSVTIRLKPMAAGRYPFKGEYNESTAQGALVIE